MLGFTAAGKAGKASAPRIGAGEAATDRGAGLGCKDGEEVAELPQGTVPTRAPIRFEAARGGKGVTDEEEVDLPPALAQATS